MVTGVVVKFIVFYILISIFSYVNANIFIGKVEMLSGNVKVKKENSIKKEKISLGFEINSGDLLVSSKNSSAKVKLNDGSVLILDERSSIHFHSIIDMEQEDGKILYKITSRDAENSLKVKTPFAIIGIKGTTFIINTRDDNAYVSLKDGLIGVESLKEEFELYRKKIQKEFDDYVAKEESEFMKFKNAQNAYEEVEHTKEFDLVEGHRISFDENRVNEDAMIDKDKAEFEYFEHLMNDIK